jgi:hypothetical protein
LDFWFLNKPSGNPAGFRTLPKRKKKRLFGKARWLNSLRKVPIFWNEFLDHQNLSLNIIITPHDWTGVARWYIFKPKIPIWVNLGGPWNGKGWYIVRIFGICYGHLVHVMAIW